MSKGGKLAAAVLGAMRGGDLLAVSPERSERILAEAFDKLFDEVERLQAALKAEGRRVEELELTRDRLEDELADARAEAKP